MAGLPALAVRNVHTRVAPDQFPRDDALGRL